jgi:hypothetical protein
LATEKQFPFIILFSVDVILRQPHPTASFPDHFQTTESFCRKIILPFPRKYARSAESAFPLGCGTRKVGNAPADPGGAGLRFPNARFVTYS